MRRKKLLTAALCAVIMMASYTVSSITGVSVLKTDIIQIALADETDAIAPAAETSAPEKEKPTPTAEEPTPSTPAATEAPTPSTPAATEAPTPSTPAATEAPTPSTPAATEAPTPSTPAATEAPSATEPPGTEQVPVQTESSGSSSGSGTEMVPPSETIPDGTEQLPSETVPGTEQFPSETVPGTEQLPSETVPGTEQFPSETVPGTEVMTEETESEKNKDTEEESESETSLYDTNEELIAHQNIVIPPDIKLEFRFTQVEKVYAIVSNREGADIYEEKSEESRAVGTLEYYGSCYILKEEEDWYYVESGNVRGFVKAEQVVTGDVADRIVSIKGIDELPAARLLVARTENEAFDYTHTTVQEVMAEKVYAVASAETAIYELRKEASGKTGVLKEGALCYILEDKNEDWVFAESSDARGFVKKSQLILGSKAEKLVEDTGEKNMELAQVLIAPEDNSSCYYTLTSVQAASQEAITREKMVNYAIQFIGNPYVWGGTSLTNGADCSGFVQSIYAKFGYSLPRVAEAQSGYGMQIPVSSAEPGDLIFYARNGYVYHVSMYIGNGKVVHAAGKRVGIITSGIAGDAVWATRVIKA